MRQACRTVSREFALATASSPLPLSPSPAAAHSPSSSAFGSSTTFLPKMLRFSVASPLIVTSEDIRWNVMAGDVNCGKVKLASTWAQQFHGSFMKLVHPQPFQRNEPGTRVRRTLPQHWLAHRRRRTPTRRHGHRAMQRGRSTSRTCVVANCAKGRETRAGYCAEHARLAQSGGAGGASWVADEETDVYVTTRTMHTAAHNPTLIHPPHAFVRRCSDSSYGAGSQQHDRSLRSYTSSPLLRPRSLAHHYQKPHTTTAHGG